MFLPILCCIWITWCIFPYINTGGNHWLQIPIRHFKNKIKLRGAQFPSLIKFIGVANWQLPVIAQKFLARLESQLALVYKLCNQSFYVKEYIIGHQTWPCILIVVLRGLTLVFLCMFEWSSIMSYTIYHTVFILCCLTMIPVLC